MLLIKRRRTLSQPRRLANLVMLDLQARHIDCGGLVESRLQVMGEGADMVYESFLPEDSRAATGRHIRRADREIGDDRRPLVLHSSGRPQLWNGSTTIGAESVLLAGGASY